MNDTHNCLYCSEDDVRYLDRTGVNLLPDLPSINALILSAIDPDDILPVADLNDHLTKPKTWIVKGRKTTHALYLALKNRNKVKRLILLDPEPFFKENRTSRAISRVEKFLSFLPQGLPFRTVTHINDPHPFLHLIRVPILIVSSTASSYAQSLAERLPVAMMVDGKSKEEIRDFMTVTARLPMRRVLKGKI